MWLGVQRYHNFKFGRLLQCFFFSTFSLPFWGAAWTVPEHCHYGRCDDFQQSLDLEVCICDDFEQSLALEVCMDLGAYVLSLASAPPVELKQYGTHTAPRKKPGPKLKPNPSKSLLRRRHNDKCAKVGEIISKAR